MGQATQSTQESFLFLTGPTSKFGSFWIAKMFPIALFTTMGTPRLVRGITHGPIQPWNGKMAHSRQLVSSLTEPSKETVGFDF